MFKKRYHLPLDARRRLICLRDAVINLLDEDRKYGFSERNLSYKLGPYLHHVMSLVWCKPLLGVRRLFSPASCLDRVPSVFVRLDVYESLEMNNVRLSEENKRLRAKLGIGSSDDLPF